MDKKQACRQLFATLQADLADYPRLMESLEAQFHAALAHDAAGLEACAADISALCARLEQSRRLRLGLVKALLPSAEEPTMAGALAVLPPAVREQGEARWQSLSGLIVASRERNLRNGQLLQQQRVLLRRVLEGEADVYAAQ